MTSLRCLVAVLLFAGIGMAQPRPNLRVAVAGPPASARMLPFPGAPDTLRILGVRVEFAQDHDLQTTGTGQFLLQPDDAWGIDPPPHDGAYFQSKYDFIRGYFFRVSGGRLVVVGHLLDSVVTLSGAMNSYAPPTIGTDNAPLASLAKEAWTRADSLMPRFDFSRYDLFVIFHAGAGRDIDLVSLLGYNPTPFDIPSIYLDSTALQSALGASAPQGILVDSGRVRITNTALLPEMESRILGSGLSSDTLRLSINGLFASMIGSRLGLPDLFDTKTGRSGIGQFGLMDGASIFAFSGLFPPEPSAWEKIELGWTQPIDLPATRAAVPIPAVEFHPATGDTIYRIPISDAEYYLLENRNRDVHHDGATVTFRRSDGTLDSIHVFSDTTGFNLYDISAIHGSVVRVDEYDWALPGTIDSTHDFDGGGVLVWHIDGRVIDAGRATNTVNADPSRRGVGLVEADGSPDIGQSYGQLDAGAGLEYGSPLDCWFVGNRSPLYKNRFDATSQPASRSTSGAATLVSLSGFTARSPRMTFDLSFGDPHFQSIAGFPKKLDGIADGPIPVDVDADGKQEFVASRNAGASSSAHGEIFAWRQDGAKCLTSGDSSGLVAGTDSTLLRGSLVLHPMGSDGLAAVLSDGVYLWRCADMNSDGMWDRVAELAVTMPEKSRLIFLDSLLCVASPDSFRVFDAQGMELSRLARPWSSGVPAIARAGSGLTVAVSSGDTVEILDVATMSSLARIDAGSSVLGIATGDVDGSHAQSIVVATAAGSLIVLDASGCVRVRTEHPGDSWISGPFLADVNHDGRLEIIMASTAACRAYSWQGILSDGFPVRMEPASGSVGDGIVSSTGDAGYPVLLNGTSAGDVYDWQWSSGRYRVFRTALGGAPISSMAVFRHGTGSGATAGLLTADEGGWIAAYDLGTPVGTDGLPWPMRGYSPEGTSNAGTSTAMPVPLGEGFLPAERAYNWPNPVYGGTTQIRYLCSSDAVVTVRIFDVGGRSVATLHGKAVGGMDGEIPWDVSGVESGVYFAHIEAAAAGRSGSVIVKIAVVK